jgi:hypothetical protein
VAFYSGSISFRAVTLAVAFRIDDFCELLVEASWFTPFPFVWLVARSSRYFNSWDVILVLHERGFLGMFMYGGKILLEVPLLYFELFRSESASGTSENDRSSLSPLDRPSLEVFLSLFLSFSLLWAFLWIIANILTFDDF